MPDNENHVFKIESVLTNAVSPETAYVQKDYPYGRKGRCHRRNYLEYSARKGCGFRYVHTTSHPYYEGQVPESFAWNKPHAQTYHTLAVLVTTNDHVAEDGEATNVKCLSYSHFGGFAALAPFINAFTDNFNESQRKVATEVMALYENTFQRQPGKRPNVFNVKVYDYLTAELLFPSLPVDDGLFGALSRTDGEEGSYYYPWELTADKPSAILNSHKLGKVIRVELL